MSFTVTLTHYADPNSLNYALVVKSNTCLKM